MDWYQFILSKCFFHVHDTIADVYTIALLMETLLQGKFVWDLVVIVIMVKKKVIHIFDLFKHLFRILVEAIPSD
jgi:hypothetical protein